MKPIAAVVPLLALFLAACGSDAGPEAVAAGGLTKAECTLLVDRHRDYALSVAPPEAGGMVKSMMDAGHDSMVDDCVAGEMFDRAGYECLADAAEGSDASHACIVATLERG